MAGGLRAGGVGGARRAQVLMLTWRVPVAHFFLFSKSLVLVLGPVSVDELVR